MAWCELKTIQTRLVVITRATISKRRGDRLTEDGGPKPALYIVRATRSIARPSDGPTNERARDGCYERGSIWHTCFLDFDRAP